MRLTGEATLRAPAGEVWAALTTPAVLAATIPGCEDLSPATPGAAQLTLTIAVAATRATYSGTVTRLQHQPPHHLQIQTTLTGEPGTITATADIHLAEDDSATHLTYEANAEVAGALAAVGQSLLQATATRLLTQVLESLDEHLTSHEEPEPAPAEPGRSPVGAAGVPSPTPTPTPRVSAPTVVPDTSPRQPAVTRGAALAALAFALGAATGAAATKLSTFWSRRKS
jgi:uncharacterized protein